MEIRVPLEKGILVSKETRELLVRLVRRVMLDFRADKASMLRRESPVSMDCQDHQEVTERRAA